MQSEHLSTQAKVAQEFKESGLIKLDLSCGKMEMLGAEYLEKMLRENAATITTLELQGNYITAREIKILAKVLPTLTALTELGLGSNDLCNAGTIILAETLQKCTLLNHLTLELRANNIRSQGAQALVKALPNCPALIELDLRGNFLKGSEVNEVNALVKINKEALFARRKNFMDTLVLLECTTSEWSRLPKDVKLLIVDRLDLQGDKSIGKNKEQIREYARYIFKRAKEIRDQKANCVIEKRGPNNRYHFEFFEPQKKELSKNNDFSKRTLRLIK